MGESGLGRLIGVLVRPHGTFAELAQRPGWAAPLLALTLLATVNSLVLIARTDFVELTREAMARSGRPVDAAQVELLAGLQERIGPLSAVVSVPLTLSALALVLWVAVKMAGGEVSYGASLATVGHGLAPWLPAMLVSLPALLGRESFGLADYQRFGFFPVVLPSSLAALAGEGTPPGVLALLSSLDLFSLWSMALLTVGFSVVAGIPRRAAGATVVGLWLVYLLGKVGWTLVGAG